MITTREATDVLREAATTERRSAEAYSYSRSAPFLILWGLIWIAGYGGMAVLPEQQAGWLWFALSVVGTGISIWLGNARAKARGRKRMAHRCPGCDRVCFRIRAFFHPAPDQ